jgi:hypothetical protein
MSFQIVYPITMTLSADSFKDAVKQYVKMSHNVNVANLIITDQYRYMKANLNYYKDGSKKKVGISLYPTTWNADQPLSAWPYTPQITYDTKEYPRSTFVESPLLIPNIIPAIVPLNPLGSAFSPILPASNVITEIRPFFGF